MPDTKPSIEAFARAGQIALELRRKVAEARAARDAPWLHDTCFACGWDGDAAIVLDPDLGLMGWECPDCHTFITTRDLEDA